MANNGIKNSWSLRDFFKSHGKMKIANMKNSETGENYKCLAFQSPINNTMTFVSFSSNLGELTGPEIVAMKDDLQVCELNVADDVLKAREEAGKQLESYSLCKKGSGSWEDVDIEW